MKQMMFALLTALLLVVPVHAEDAATAKVRNAVNGLIPGEKPDSVTPAVIPGLYEVAYGPRVFFVSADGRYLISGDMFDIEEGTNLSEARRGKGRLAALESAGKDSMITYRARGKEKHVITVFTDIDCTYCRKLHSGMKEMNDLGITVRYLAFPRAGIPSASYDKAVAVWCAADRNKSMDQAKNENKINMNTCAKNPVADHLALGQMLGVTGTPALVLDDGALVPGYLPPQRLLQELEGIKQAKR